MLLNIVRQDITKMKTDACSMITARWSMTGFQLKK